MLSEYQLKIADLCNIRIGNVKKLMVNLKLKTRINTKKYTWNIRIQSMTMVKGCLYRLNRCASSPAYILYQLNGKKKFIITYHIFDLKHFHFFKKWLPATMLFPQTMLCLWNLQHENRGKPAFKLFNVLECPTEFCFKNQNNLGEIDNQIKELDWL